MPPSDKTGSCTAVPPGSDVTKVTTTKRHSWLERASAVMYNGMMDGFGWLTTHAVGHPWWMIVGVVLLSVVMAQGVWFYTEQLAPDKLYTPQDSPSVSNRDWVQLHFGFSPSRFEAYFVAESSYSVLTKVALVHILEYHDWVTQTAFGEIGGVSYDYNYSCYRYSQTDGCKDVSSILKLWDYNSATLANDPDPLATINGVGNWRRVSPSGPDLDYYLTDIERDAGGLIKAAGGARMTFDVRYPKRRVSGKGEINPEVDSFERAVSDHTYTRRYEQYDTAHVAVYAWTRADQEYEENKAIDSDVSILIIGYMLLSAFTALVLSRNRVRYSHATLAAMSVLSVGMSTISAYGLCWYIGVPYNSVMNVLVLLLLGLGVDDSFVIMFSWWDHAEVPDMKERMIATMRHAGPAILLTSVTDLVAFSIGTTTSIPALRDFCVYASVGIVFDFTYQVTFFVACTYLSSKRQEQSKADFLCCVTVADDTGCCVGKETDFREGDPGVTRKVFGVWLPRAVLSKPGRIIIIVLATVFVSIGVYGCADGLRQNFDMDWFVPSGSRMQAVFDVRDSFGGRSFPCSLWAGAVDYPNEQRAIQEDITAAVARSSYVVAGSVSVWLYDFQAWVAEVHPAHHTSEIVDGVSYSKVAPAEFYRLLRVWADTATGPRATWFHIGNIRWNDQNSAIKASKYPFLLTEAPASDGVVAYNAIKEFAAARKASKLDMFAWENYFIFWEGHGVILSEMIQNVGLSAMVVFILVTLITANVLLSISVLLNVVLIDVCIIGWMPVVGVYVNSVSTICVLVAVGLVVDYSVHIASDFVKVASDADTTPNTQGLSHGQMRSAYALYKMGPGVGAGGLSTYLAVLPLALADSYIFIVFFRMFTLIIFFGLFFGMCFLPVIFSFVNLPPNIGAASIMSVPHQMPLQGYCLVAPSEHAPPKKESGTAHTAVELDAMPSEK